MSFVPTGSMNLTILEGYDHAVMALPGMESENRSFPELTLRKEESFFMEDNRDNPKGSRTFGIVPRDNFVGEACRGLIWLKNPWHQGGLCHGPRNV
ncbi:MAG: S26 family signal peptidase [Akkermansiaceae bacterium]